MKMIKSKKSFWLLVILFLISLSVELWAPHSPLEQNIDNILSSSDKNHIMGTDDLGRDLFSRVFFATRLSFSLGFLSALFAIFIGFCYGVISGWLGGRWDEFLMRGVEFFTSLPTLVLLLLIKVSLEHFNESFTDSYFILFFTLSLVGWRTTARVIRGQVLQLREMNFIESAQSLGASNFRIIVFHLAPNLTAVVWSLFIFQVPAHILFESFLSFIGLGFEPPQASLGTLMSEGWSYFYTGSSHMILFPALILFTLILLFQILGYDLRKNKSRLF